MNPKAFIDHKRKIIAFWAPKCACTSVAHWFVNGVLATDPVGWKASDSHGHLVKPYKKGDPRIYLMQSGYSYDFMQAVNCAQTNHYLVVHFTRHPALRLVSAYLGMFVKCYGEIISTFNQLQIFAKDLVKIIYMENGWSSSSYQGIRFSDLVSYLTYARVDQTKKQHIDDHWGLQMPEKIIRNNHLRPDYIVHVERFDEDLSAVNKELGIDLVVGKYNATRFDSQRTVQDNLSGIFSHELSSQAISIRPDNLLNSELMASISNIYASDYRYFKYVPNDTNFIPA